MHLAVLTTEQESWSEVGPRLRGATLHTFKECPETGRVYQGLIMLGPILSPGVIEAELRAGVSVLVAAPVALPPEQLDWLDEVARAAGVSFSLANPERYRPSRQLIKEQLAGKVGPAGLIRIQRWEPAPGAVSETRSDLASDLDIALWLMAALPEVVYALEAPMENGGRYLQVHLGFPGGGAALVDYTNRLPPGADYQSLSVIAFSGAAYADDQQNMHLAYRGGTPMALRAEEGIRQYAALCQDFVDALATGRTPGGVTAWRHLFMVMAAVKESMQSRRAVRLEAS